MISECTLLSNLIEGDQYAFNQFVKRHQSRMDATARAIVGPMLADDVVQDAWLSIFRNIKSFEGRASLRTWLLVITANMAKAHLRKSRNELSRIPRNALKVISAEEQEEHGASVLWHDETPDALLARDQKCEELEAGLQALPKRQREVVYLYDYQGMAMNDIADRHGITQGNVRVLLHRARATLLSAMERRE
jgi:RNA polymerase sigma-70 factor (ECF subfamily)